MDLETAARVSLCKATIDRFGQVLVLSPLALGLTRADSNGRAVYLYRPTTADKREYKFGVREKKYLISISVLVINFLEPQNCSLCIFGYNRTDKLFFGIREQPKERYPDCICHCLCCPKPPTSSANCHFISYLLLP